MITVHVQQNNLAAFAASQEVRKHCFIALALAAFGYCLEYEEFLLQFVAHFHYAGHVVASVAVIWRRPDCHQVLRLKPKLESLLD